MSNGSSCPANVVVVVDTVEVVIAVVLVLDVEVVELLVELVVELELVVVTLEGADAISQCLRTLGAGLPKVVLLQAVPPYNAFVAYELPAP